MQLITGILKSIFLYFFVILFTCFINNVSLSNAESVTFPKIGYRSVIDKVDDNEKLCIPCNFLDNSLKSIKLLMNDFENLNTQYCSESSLSSRKSNAMLQKREFKPELRSRYGYGYGLGHGFGHRQYSSSNCDPRCCEPIIHTDDDDDDPYRRARTSTRRPPRPPGAK
ncbi:uncharacterized protein LOC122855682 [Aphidius gifuensis]|uniref:uncharacterized protein LOC122855682 n=1 Tax=Aphidius gifuensis TaxID=684658 RepID=UPI001CDD6B98|nr:uncharacterized protein LOC122855682 [Aphidius gifuensis]